MSYCPQCGARAPEGAAFCGVCGTRLSAPSYSATLDQESNPYAVGAQAVPASSSRQECVWKPTFGEALKRCLGKKYADFSGRASRREYWYFVLWMLILIVPIVIVAIFLGGIAGAIVGQDLSTIVVGGVMILWSLYLFIPGLAVLTRRFHDIGLPTWLAVTAYIVANALRLGRTFIEFGSPWRLAFSAPTLVISVLILVAAVVPGKPEPNRYGLPPVERPF